MELKSSGSPVRVGKMDATAYSGEKIMKPANLSLEPLCPQLIMSCDCWSTKIMMYCMLHSFTSVLIFVIMITQLKLVL